MPQDPPQVMLGPAQYGKAEVRVLHVDRAAPRHEITDPTVTVTLAGDMAGTYLTGDNSGVLTTDAQKNTVYAFARSGVRPVEEFALRLARHFEPVDFSRTRSSTPARRPSAPVCTPTGAPRSWPGWTTWSC